MIAVVLAHQGGWDEALFVALPISLFAFLLYLANKKAQAQLDREDAEAAARKDDEAESP